MDGAISELRITCPNCNVRCVRDLCDCEYWAEHGASTRKRFVGKQHDHYACPKSNQCVPILVMLEH